MRSKIVRKTMVALGRVVKEGTDNKPQTEKP